MSVSKKKNKQRDFFVLDIADVVPKDDMLSMEHPIFSLSTKPDRRARKYETNGKSLEIIPSELGLATIHDKDILIWAMSKVLHAKNRKLPYSRTVMGKAHDLLAATNRPTNNIGYQRLEDAFKRLSGTRFISDIPLDSDRHEKRFFGLIDEGGFIYSSGNKRLESIQVTLPNWLFEAIETDSVLSISEDYFQLRRPVERRLYEIGRKHCGSGKKWEINLDKLRAKTGSSSPLKLFRHYVRQIIKDNETPTYKMELTPQDKVIYRPRRTRRIVSSDLVLESWAEDKARIIARDKGWDYYALLNEWKGYAKSGEPPRNAGAAFVGFCKQKENLR